MVATAAAAQERGPVAAGPVEIRGAIDRLGDLDYDTRMGAARLLRRAPAAQVVPALVDAASQHGDGYIRFKALVLLTGFKDPRIEDTMGQALASPNDRLREVAYGWFEMNPSPALVPRFLAALETEVGEFVRPSLVRALAAQGQDPRVRDALVAQATRGVDYFRSTVIEALGDYRLAYAVPTLVEIAKLEGPLQDDAATALGKIGDKNALGVLAELQRSAPRETQPAVAAAICLMGVNCSSHVGYLQQVLDFGDSTPGYQELLRGAAHGLGAIAVHGNEDALKILLDAGIPSQDPQRAPLALALGQVALRNTPLMLKTLAARPDQAGAIGLLAEGFDMLEEDLEEERFFAEVRSAYWAAPDESPTRALGAQLITRLHF